MGSHVEDILEKHYAKPSDDSEDGRHNRHVLLSRSCSQRTTSTASGGGRRNGGVSALRTKDSDITNLKVSIVISRWWANDVVSVADACARLIEAGRVPSF